MLVCTSQSLPRSSRWLDIPAALVACLLPSFQPSPAQADEPATAKANGRIYVATTYRVEQPVRADSAIISIDPSTGDWQIVVEKDATKGSAGEAVRLSPDRRTLVFWRLGDGIWKCESDGQFPIKIFDQQHNSVLRAVWSPDGKHMVATKGEVIKQDSKDVLQYETWRFDADGRNAVKLPIPDTESVDDWSSDGQWFVTSTSRPKYGLYLMKTDGTQERMLTEGGGKGFARFSPDGKMILYRHLPRTDPGSIWTVDIDGENATEVIKDNGTSFPDGAFWSPDGKQIAVVLFDWQLENGRKMYPRYGTGKFRIEIMDADGTNRRQIPLKGGTLPFISSMGDWR